jgi:hypothetical protein
MYRKIPALPRKGGNRRYSGKKYEQQRRKGGNNKKKERGKIKGKLNLKE